MEHKKEALQQIPKGHLSEEDIKEYFHQPSPDTSYLKTLEHISHCSYCAEHMAQLLEEEGLIHAPKDFRENTLQEAANTKIQAGLSLHKTSARLQLLFYSFRVGAALLGALTILFFSSLGLAKHSWQVPFPSLDRGQAIFEKNVSISQNLGERSRYVNGLLQDFSDMFIYKEDIQHD